LKLLAYRRVSKEDQARSGLGLEAQRQAISDFAEREGLTIFELPVRWVEDRDSSVRIVATALENLRGIARLRRRGAGRETDPRLTAASRVLS